jgi:hypothetical protein
MDEASINDHLARQFLAALAMLRTAIEKCPEALWVDAEDLNRYWHIAYHALFYTHFYLQAGEAEFQPWVQHRAGSQYLGRKPGAAEDADLPYSREEALAYCDFCCAEIAAKLPLFPLDGDSGFYWLKFSKLELHLYNLRHLQHHTGQLADRLRTRADIGVPWAKSG